MSSENIWDLEIADLTFRYASHNEESRQFELSVPYMRFPAGTVSVLMGENGSGKTTLLKILAGLLRPDTGFLGVRNGAALQQRCTMVHQDPYLLSGSVHRNVAYGMHSSGIHSSDRARAIQDCLKAVGLDGFSKRNVKQLSGGERQRVALARSLATGPQFLLLDEPTASVDARSIALLEDVISRISGEGTTVVITSHDSSFSYRTADSVYRLEAGNPMPGDVNLIRGRISRSDDRFAYFAAGDTEIRCSTAAADARALILPFTDVILSPEPVETSAQNQFSGVVERIVASGSLFRVDIHCGFRVSSVVTGYSIEKLGINSGDSLYVVFKASAVRLY